MMPKDYMEKTIWTLGEYLLYMPCTLGWLIAKNKNKYTKKSKERKGAHSGFHVIS